MESDERVNENLRLQFKALQEQQHKRLQRLMERKKEKEEEQPQQQERSRSSEAFGVQDQLHLLRPGGSSTSDIGKRLLEDENDQLQDQIRELKDENGRLHKLVQEKEFEIRHLRKKLEEGKLALAGTAGLAGDVAATKIVELSKKNRELTAELESERTKVKQLNNRVKGVEKELQNLAVNYTGKESGNGHSRTQIADGTPAESPELKALQEKLAATNLKMIEYRNQIQSMKQELKVAHKVLVSEVGEEVNISQLAASSGSWRGRAQQILALQGRVRELENQLGQGRSPVSELSLEEELSGVTVPKRVAAQEKNLFRIRTLEKERKEALEKITAEYEAFKKDNEDLKKKLEASKARNTVLSNEVKMLKMQMATILEKGKHDNELIDALLSQQKNMQEVLTRLSQQEQKNKDSQQNLNMQCNSEAQKQSSLVSQLKYMVAEREAKVKELEDEIKQLTLKNHHRKESSGKILDVQEFPSVAKSEKLSPIRSLSDSGDQPWSGSRTVSKLGHELIQAQSPNGNISASPRSSEVRVLQAQVTEYRTLCQAAEVERDRLMELVSVLQKRVEESNEKLLGAEKRLQEERRRCVLLEQQAERLKMDTAKNVGTQKLSARGKAGPSLSISRHSVNFNGKTEVSFAPADLPLETQIEELRTQLAIQMDENEAIKTSLKSTLKTKEDDLKLYHEMMGEVKQIFIQALRQHKQERNGR
ncbi:coiled-coil domain-containing protein 13 isoform X1 [Xenopus tropicalis]|uniref:Coiled-coil domain-containing protein 13 isoform X1 n=1 Tax=Xenopus tropicalis TaxID=8364 RepID=A0A8J0R2Q4_XENTR|nr:coiled-coil domain-containing protein 13 isoform X1 [Xenopus tropicalis]|eukprot:XP_004915640.1 PREDICTED: coiled-coil domain-containing protein 13 isoform X1 [Xenopus tropicalis]